MSDRGRLLTDTFRRMNDMGLTEAEDIIAEMAEEIENIKNMTVVRNDDHKICSLLPDMPECLVKRIYSIDISADGSMSIYFGDYYTDNYDEYPPSQIQNN